jgi:hypothetical protein
MTKKQALNYLRSSGFSKEQIKAVVDALQGSPTKNDLGVDCISRQAAIDAIRRIHPIDTDYDCTLFDKVDVMYVLNDLPSVTPIRPKGHWTEEFNDLEGEVRFTCSSCGKYQLFGTDFCYHCGSDNREVVEE